MHPSAKAIVLWTLGIIALWVVVTSAVGLGAETLFGRWLADRFSPFNSGHLLEEASGGTYSPIADPVFVMHALGIAVVVFGVPTFYLGRGALRHRPLLAAIPALIVTSSVAALWRYVWAEDFPDGMRWGVVLTLGAYVVAAAAAVVLSARHKNRD
jgi:hypothetical protein